MFYRMCDRDVERMKIQMKRISDYFATIRYESTDRPGINVFIDNWNRVMDYWSNRYTGLFFFLSIATFFYKL